MHILISLCILYSRTKLRSFFFSYKTQNELWSVHIWCIFSGLGSVLSWAFTFRVSPNSHRFYVRSSRTPSIVFSHWRLTPFVKQILLCNTRKLSRVIAVTVKRVFGILFSFQIKARIIFLPCIELGSFLRSQLQ
jgi:hypothetical protein